MVETNNNAHLFEQLKKDIATWECQALEFKTTATSDHEIAEAIAAFATSNFGRIYLGIDNSRQITGVDNVFDGLGKDTFLRRIAHISKDLVKPPIRVKVSFIETESKVVVRIDVPKGEEPVYYVDHRPYTRDLSTTRKLEPDELKNLYMQYYSSILGQPPSDEQTDYFVEVLTQLSDIQLICLDYADHLIKPDVYQLKYDIGATARRLTILSAKEFGQNLGIDQTLKHLSNRLEDAESYEFYMGMQSVKDFGEILNDCLKLSNQLYEQVKKNMPRPTLPNFKRVVTENIDLLEAEWDKAEKYFQRGELEKLRDSFRRFGYTFHRLGNLPDADLQGISIELREAGEKLRNLSSTEKYFLTGIGENPLIKINEEIQPTLTNLETIKKSLNLLQ